MSWCECMTEEEFFDQYVDWETAVAHMAPETRRAMWEMRRAEMAEHEAEEGREAQNELRRPLRGFGPEVGLRYLLGAEDAHRAVLGPASACGPFLPPSVYER